MHMELPGTKTTVEKKSKVEISNFKTVIAKSVLWHKGKNTDQWNKIQSLEINPHVNSHVVITSVYCTMSKKVFQHLILEQFYSHVE